MARNDILEKKEEILQWIEEGQPKSYICRQLNCKPETLNRYLGIMNIQYDGNSGLKGFKRNDNGYIPAAEYINSSCVHSSVLREKLFREGIKPQKCERCGLSAWQNEFICLELHHIDGNHYNNNFDNLQILCPNCHSLTQSYRHRAEKIKIYDSTDNGAVERKKKNRKEKTNTCIICGALITDKANYCIKCFHATQQRVERPDREKLKQEIRIESFLSLAAKYGVSDKAITKWCLAYNLPSKKKDIKAYSDEEWALI